MLAINIYVSDSRIQNEWESKNNLGLRNLKRPTDTLCPMRFDEKLLSSFWVDYEIEESTGTRDIIFHIDGVGYRTPLTDETYELFNCTLKQREND